MTTGHDRPSVRRGLEPGRRVVGWLAEFGCKAYAAAAAASVALSDAETVGGKSHDAVAAVSNLLNRYHAANYVADNREDVRDALDYLRDHTPPKTELEETVDRSSETLRDLETVSAEIGAARAAAEDIGLSNFSAKVNQLLDHLGSAWAARPDSDSMRDLAAGPRADSFVVRLVVGHRCWGRRAHGRGGVRWSIIACDLRRMSMHHAPLGQPRRTGAY